MPYNKILLATCCGFLLSACATTNQPSMKAGHHNFGKAVKANMAAQMVAPTPEQKANTYIPANRERQRLARKAYEEDKVKEPKPLSVEGDKS